MLRVRDELSHRPGHGGSADAWACPLAIAATCPDDADRTIPLLLSASEFGAGTRFVDVASRAVLAERDTAGTRTISIIACGDWAPSCTGATARIASTASGRVFAATGPATALVDPCFTGQVVGANPRAAGSFCGAIFNLFLMDETAVYGTTGCASE